MAASGRPTPQVAAEGFPRFKDLTADAIRNPEANPFVRSHRDFGPPLLPGSEAWPFRGRWADCFGREAPLVLEIGSGNGFFLTELARRQPKVDHIGVELRYKRTVMVARKLRAAGVSNARIVRYHAAFLDDLFTHGSLAGVWVNHPDPWPKERHEKHRLISRWFMEDVARLLKPGGYFHLKSDFGPNIDRVAGLLEGLPLRVVGQSDDVITGPAPWPDDIETNYQSKFRKRGLPVYAIALERSLV